MSSCQFNNSRAEVSQIPPSDLIDALAQDTFDVVSEAIFLNKLSKSHFKVETALAAKEQLLNSLLGDLAYRTLYKLPEGHPFRADFWGALSTSQYKASIDLLFDQVIEHFSDDLTTQKRHFFSKEGHFRLYLKSSIAEPQMHDLLKSSAELFGLLYQLKMLPLKGSQTLNHQSSIEKAEERRPVECHQGVVQDIFILLFPDAKASLGSITLMLESVEKAKLELNRKVAFGGKSASLLQNIYLALNAEFDHFVEEVISTHHLDKDADKQFMDQCNKASLELLLGYFLGVDRALLAQFDRCDPKLVCKVPSSALYSLLGRFQERMGERDLELRKQVFKQSKSFVQLIHHRKPTKAYLKLINTHPFVQLLRDLDPTFNLLVKQHFVMGSNSTVPEHWNYKALFKRIDDILFDQLFVFDSMHDLQKRTIAYDQLFLSQHIDAVATAISHQELDQLPGAVYALYSMSEQVAATSPIYLMKVVHRMGEHAGMEAVNALHEGVRRLKERLDLIKQQGAQQQQLAQMMSVVVRRVADIVKSSVRSAEQQTATATNGVTTNGVNVAYGAVGVSTYLQALRQNGVDQACHEWDNAFKSKLAMTFLAHSAPMSEWKRMLPRLPILTEKFVEESLKTSHKKVIDAIIHHPQQAELIRYVLPLLTSHLNCIMPCLFNEAIRLKHFSLLQCLLGTAEPALMKSCDAHGRTPIHIAALHGCAEVIAMVGRSIKLKPFDYNRKDRTGSTPAYIAASHGDVEVMKALRGVGLGIEDLDPTAKKPSQQTLTLPILAAKGGHVHVLKYLLEIGFDLPRLNRPESKGHTPLLIAAQTGQLEVLHALFEMGMKGEELLMACTQKGENVLHAAVAYGGIHAKSVLVALMQRDLPKKLFIMENSVGNTPIMLAVEQGRFDLVKLLAEPMGLTDIMKTNANGETIAHLAAKQGQWFLFAWMLDLGVTKNALLSHDHEGKTPVHSAVAFGKLGIFQELVMLGFKPEKVNPVQKGTAMTVAHQAAKEDNADVIEAMIRVGIDAKVFDKPVSWLNRKTVVEVAAIENSHRVLSVLRSIYVQPPSHLDFRSGATL